MGAVSHADGIRHSMRHCCSRRSACDAWVASNANIGAKKKGRRAPLTGVHRSHKSRSKARATAARGLRPSTKKGCHADQSTSAKRTSPRTSRHSSARTASTPCCQRHQLETLLRCADMIGAHASTVLIASSNEVDLACTIARYRRTQTIDCLSANSVHRCDRAVTGERCSVVLAS